MWESWVRSLGWEDLLEKGKATHSSILAWRIPWTGLQRVRHDWATFTFTFSFRIIYCYCGKTIWDLSSYIFFSFFFGFIEIKFCTIKFVNFKSVYDWRVLINAWNHVIIIKLQIQNFLSPPQVPPNPCSVCPLPSLGPWEQLICILLLHFAFSWV